MKNGAGYGLYVFQIVINAWDGKMRAKCLANAFKFSCCDGLAGKHSN